MRVLTLSLLIAPLSAADDKPDADEVALPPLGVADEVLRLDFKAVDAKYADRRPGDAALRKAVRDAQVLLWAGSPVAPPAALKAAVTAARKKQAIPAALLTTRYVAPKGGPMTNRFKDQLLATNRDIARLTAAMEQQLEDLQGRSEARDKECPRWQAHYDLVTALLMLRLAYLQEHATALGDLRKEFPDRDPAKHKGWQLEPAEGLRDPAGKKLAKAAKKTLEQLGRDHDGTPWAKAAKAAEGTVLSVTWKPW